jgi:hypothetical protein
MSRQRTSKLQSQGALFPLKRGISLSIGFSAGAPRTE